MRHRRPVSALLAFASVSSRFSSVESFAAATSTCRPAARNDGVGVGVGGGGGGDSGGSHIDKTPNNANTWRSGICHPPAWTTIEGEIDRPYDESIVDHALRGITTPGFAKRMESVLKATRDLCQHTPCRSPDPAVGEKGLAFLFVSPAYNVTFPDIVRVAHETLGEDVKLLSVVGSSVIGGGSECDEAKEDGISLLCGILPSTADAETFRFGPDDDDDDDDDDDKEEEEKGEENGDDASASSKSNDMMPKESGIGKFSDRDELAREVMQRVGKAMRDKLEAEEARKKKGLPPASSPYWNLLGRNQAMPSYIVFSDGTAPVREILDGLDSSGRSRCAVVAGGIAEACYIKVGNSGILVRDHKQLPSVAVDGKVFPPDSCVGVALSGSVGLQTVVSQGCRPVGPAFGVTKAKGFEILELENMDAATIVGDDMVLNLTDLYLTQEERRMADEQGLWCGIADRSSSDVKRGDYLISQIMTTRRVSFYRGGRNATSIAVMGGNGSVKKGDIFRLHVRDEEAAREDIEYMTMRAKTERSFAAGSERIGVPLAALQISATERGRCLFGEDSSNFDLGRIQNLVGENGPVAGFFARGEISSVGVTGIGLTDAVKRTYVHRLSTLAAMLCDFSSDDMMPAQREEDDTSDDDYFPEWE